MSFPEKSERVIGKGDLLTVNRGSCASEGERLSRLFNQVVTGKVKDTEFPALVKKINDWKWNYGGTFHSVYFRVDTRIVLQQLGFFGPFFEPTASYFVHIEIFKPRDNNQPMPNCWESPRVAKVKLDMLAKKDDVFYVDLGEGVEIVPHRWYLVQFNLEGPNTLRCETCFSHLTVESERGDIHFEFNKGSFQMPSMKFRVVDKF